MTVTPEPITATSLIASVASQVTANAIIMAVVAAGAVFALLRRFIRAIRSAAR